ncbi:MAG: helicase-related protein, partial [Telluria sp.]
MPDQRNKPPSSPPQPNSPPERKPTGQQAGMSLADQLRAARALVPKAEAKPAADPKVAAKAVPQEKPAGPRRAPTPEQLAALAGGARTPRVIPAEAGTPGRTQEEKPPMVAEQRTRGSRVRGNEGERRPVAKPVVPADAGTPGKTQATAPRTEARPARHHAVIPAQAGTHGKEPVAKQAVIGSRPRGNDQQAAEQRSRGSRVRGNDAGKAERTPLPPITFPEDLPVSGRRQDIAKALTENQVIIVSGETGSGKTTQLPKICLELGRGAKGLIGHTQPRRIAASSTAKRIAAELNSQLGELVGYKVRFNDTLHPGAWVKLMTDGILLAETQTDPLLKAYDTIIIDEAHERSLNIDFLLGYLKQVLPRRPDLKVIITSATIDADRFARHFGTPEKPAPVIEVSGRLYKVEVRYRPIERDAIELPGGDANKSKAAAAREKRDLMDGVVDAVDELCRIGSGDVLVFLPGAAEIRRAAAACAELAQRNDLEVLPLHGDLSPEEQDRAVEPGKRRKVILSTNVAETSLTIEGVVAVIDSGLARIAAHSPWSGLPTLRVQRVSRASATQRAGRAGRTRAGRCLRLYTKHDHDTRPAFEVPEIRRLDLAEPLLLLAATGVEDPAAFGWFEAPGAAALDAARGLLERLGAVDARFHPTEIGRRTIQLPLHPRQARVIVEAERRGVGREACVVAALLGEGELSRDRGAARVSGP